MGGGVKIEGGMEGGEIEEEVAMVDIIRLVKLSLGMVLELESPHDFWWFLNGVWCCCCVACRYIRRNLA